MAQALPSKPVRPPVRSGQPKATRKAFAVISTFYALTAVLVRVAGSRNWGLFSDLLARVQTRKPTHKSHAFVRRARAVLTGGAAEADLLALHRRNEAAVHQRVVFTAALRRPGGWDPEIVLTGREILQKALAQGRGVILWSDPFVHSAIIGKRAFAQAGFRAWHLSAQGHGLLNSPMAERFLNHRVIEVELRYLAGRIVFHPRSATVATREMVKILAGGGIISLTNNAYIGKTVSVPFGRGALRLARTPLNLAASRGVPLLPFQVLERERFARYEVIVGANLADRLSPGSSDPVRALAAIYADYLLDPARANPEQFGWGMIDAPEID